MSNTQFWSYSYIDNLVKMESVLEITVFGLKMKVQSGLEKKIEIPPGKNKETFVNEFVSFVKKIMPFRQSKQ